MLGADNEDGWFTILPPCLKLAKALDQSLFQQELYKTSLEALVAV